MTDPKQTPANELEHQVLEYVLRYRHKELWSIQGNIGYATNPDDLKEKKAFLEKANPHLRYWIEKY